MYLPRNTPRDGGGTFSFRFASLVLSLSLFLSSSIYHTLFLFLALILSKTTAIFGGARDPAISHATPVIQPTRLSPRGNLFVVTLRGTEGYATRGSKGAGLIEASLIVVSPLQTAILAYEAQINYPGVRNESIGWPSARTDNLLFTSGGGRGWVSRPKTRGARFLLFVLLTEICTTRCPLIFTEPRRSPDSDSLEDPRRSSETPRWTVIGGLDTANGKSTLWRTLAIKSHHITSRNFFTIFTASICVVCTMLLYILFVYAFWTMRSQDKSRSWTPYILRSIERFNEREFV